MTIGNALTFIKQGLHDGTLRRRLNSAPDMSQLHHVLEDEKLIFSPHDFSEAIHHRLFQCQEEEEAEQIKEFKMWWEMLSRSLEPVACGNQSIWSCK